MRIIAADGIEISEEMNQEITKGVDWLKDWISGVYESGNYVERLDKSEYGWAYDQATGKECYNQDMKNLNGVTIYVCDDIKKTMVDEALAGNLHLKAEYGAYYGPGYRMGSRGALISSEAAKIQVEEGTGVKWFPEVEEPVIFIDRQSLENGDISPEMVRELSIFIGADESLARVEPVVVPREDGTEFTSMAKQVGKYPEYASSWVYADNPDVTYDPVLDSSENIYKNLMSFRYQFDLAPDHVLSKEEVAQFRGQISAEMRKYKEDLGLDPEKPFSYEELKAAKASHPEVGNIPGYCLLFDRLTDEQIAMVGEMTMVRDLIVEKEEIKKDLRAQEGTENTVPNASVVKMERKLAELSSGGVAGVEKVQTDRETAPISPNFIKDNER